MAERKRADRAVLTEYLVLDERFKQHVTDYQGGKMRDETFFRGLESIHEKLVKSFGAYINPADIERMEQALVRLEGGQREYLIRNPQSYHQIWWEIHLMLENDAKEVVPGLEKRDDLSRESSTQMQSTPS